MQPSTVHVRAPSRLHFGLFSFGQRGRQYGGVGVMLEHPSLSLEICAAPRFEVVGEQSEILTQGARQWAQFRQLDELPRCRVTILQSLPRHVGLGSGTQLMSALVAGLQAFAQLPPLTAQELARATGRGRRSAVGTYGFLHGGLIVELGKMPGEELAPLEQRMDFPAAWRFVLVQTGARAGLSGHEERRAFECLPPVGRQLREELIAEVRSVMLPALHAQDCTALGESLYRYGRTAGSCFASVQGGPYNGPRLTALVQEIRALGIPGVGQSSWGPMLFCLVPDQARAVQLENDLSRRHAEEQLKTWITAADNCGALITST